LFIKAFNWAYKTSSIEILPESYRINLTAVINHFNEITNCLLADKGIGICLISLPNLIGAKPKRGRFFINAKYKIFQAFL